MLLELLLSLVLEVIEDADASITSVTICRVALRAVRETETLLRLSRLILRHCEIKLDTVASERYCALLAEVEREFAISSRI